MPLPLNIIPQKVDVKPQKLPDSAAIWAVIEHLIKVKNDHFGSVRWRKSLSRMRVTTAAGKVCLSDSLQSWWNNELLPDLWLWFFSPPCHKCNMTTGITHLTPFRMRRLPMALLPGPQVQLLCTLISINTHCLLDHHQCRTFGPLYWGFP